MVDSEVYTLALKNTINELRNINPHVQHTFLFSQNSEILVGDDGTPEKAPAQVKNAFEGILERSEVLGGLTSITFQGENGAVRVYRFDKYYLVMVADADADMNYVGSVTRVLIPTVLKLLGEIIPTPTEGLKETETKPSQDKEVPIEKNEEKPKEQPGPSDLLDFLRERTESEKRVLPAEPKPVQLMVEDLHGFRDLFASDTVRIDNETLLEWEKTLETTVEIVDIETFNGKTLRCKVKPIKDSRYIGKGAVQMPDKVQEALETKKGDLVRVKPMVSE